MYWINIVTFAALVYLAAARPQSPAEDDEYADLDDGSGFEACGRSNKFEEIDVDLRATGKHDAIKGEFPHMCVMFYKKDGSNVYVGGASLVQTNLLITLASAVRRFTEHESDRGNEPDDYEDEVDLRGTDRTCNNEWAPKTDLFVRCGDIRIQAEDNDEVTQKVELILLHPEYSDSQLVNDIAVLKLGTEYVFTEHIGRICLPSPGRDEHEATQCMATGHGKDKFGSFGYYSETLRKVELPLVDNTNCQKILNEKHFRNTSIKSWTIDQSFICAGGEEGKDTCEGDGGSPLVCDLPPEEDDVTINLREEDEQKLTQVGIVAWGIGCGRDIPAVYTKVSHPPVRCWLDQVLSCHGAGIIDLRSQEINLRNTDDAVLLGCEDYHETSNGGCCADQDEEDIFEGDEDLYGDDDDYDYDQRQITLREDGKR